MTDIAPELANADVHGTQRIGPYGPGGARAKITYGWATGPVQILLYIASVIPALIAIVVVVAVLIATSGADMAAMDEAALLAAYLVPALIVLIAVQFPAWAGAVIFWTKVIERRSLASIGFRGPNGLGRYLRGLGLGVVLAIAVMAAGAAATTALGGATSLEMGGFAAERLAQPGVFLTFGVIVLLTLPQSAAEEIAFRGWMLSSTAMRWGLVAAIVWSSVAFGLLHFHFFLIGGAAYGTLAVGSVTLIGVILSLLAIAERSIWGASGVHGGYNSTLFITTIAVLAGTSKDGLSGAIGELAESFLGEFDPEAPTHEVLGMFILFAALSAVAAWRFSAWRARSGRGEELT